MADGVVSGEVGGGPIGTDRPRSFLSALRGGMPVWAILGFVALFAVMIPPGGGRSTSNAGMTLATVAGVAVAWPLLRRGFVPPLAWATAVVCVLWTAVSAVSWAIHGSPVRWSWTWTVQPLILLSAVSLLLWLLQEPRRWPVAALAALLGSGVAGAIAHLGSSPEPDVWRYALGPGITTLVLVLAALAWHTGYRVSAVAAVAGIGGINLVLGLRSALLQVGVAVAAALVYAVVSRFTRRWALTVVAVGTALLVALMVPAYGALAESGALGREQRYKWKSQSDAVGGVLLGGRPEFALAMDVLPLVPVTGLGFDPELPAKVAQARDSLAFSSAVGNPAIETLPRQFWASARADQMLVALRYWAAEGHGLYLHSAVFQFWLWIGPYAVVPFGLMLVAGLLLVSRAARRFGMAGVLGSVGLLTAYVWNALFSPMSPSVLTLNALIVALACAFEVQWRREATEQAAPGGGADPGGPLEVAAGHEGEG